MENHNFERLKEHILSLSVSKNFEVAKTECSLHSIEVSEEMDFCPCGQDIKPPMQPGQSFCAGLRDAFSEDVHGIGLDHARHHQYVVLIEVSAGTGQHLDAGHLRLLHGQRAGLV